MLLAGTFHPFWLTLQWGNVSVWWDILQTTYSFNCFQRCFYVPIDWAEDNFPSSLQLWMGSDKILLNYTEVSERGKGQGVGNCLRCTIFTSWDTTPSDLPEDEPKAVHVGHDVWLKMTPVQSLIQNLWRHVALRTNSSVGGDVHFIGVTRVSNFNKN